MQGNRPIAFSSRSLNEAEERYPQIEKEMLSILYACKKFHNYIYGNTTKVMTDHSPLVQIFQKNFNKVILVRLQKMKMKLIIYDSCVEYLPGKLMLIADLLSRNFMEIKEESEQELEGVIHAVENRNTNFQEIAKVTESDEELKEVIKLYERGWPKSKKQVPENMRQYWNLRDSISVENGVVFYESRIRVPKELRSKVLRLVHEGYNGVTKTILRASILESNE